MTVDLLGYFAARHDQLLSVARALVERESPTRDATAAAELIAEIRRRLEAAGAAIRLVESENGPHLLARFDGDSAAGRPVMLLGHVDTVWPRGTLAQRPFRVEDGARLRPRGLRHEERRRRHGGRARGDRRARPAAAASDQDPAHLRRGERQPDLARPDRGPSRRVRGGARSGAAASRRQRRRPSARSSRGTS